MKRGLKKKRRRRNHKKMKLPKVAPISTYLLMQEFDLPYTWATNSRK